VSGTAKDGCGAEGAEFDPMTSSEDDASRPDRGVPAPSGLPVSDDQYRALKERARTRRGPADHREDAVAQEDGDGIEEGGPGNQQER
jgi:hypothetical protein